MSEMVLQVCRRRFLAAAVCGLTIVTGCKAKLYTTTVRERIAADAHKPGRLPREALHCQAWDGRAIAIDVKELRDDYTGVVHIKVNDASPPCDGDFDFEMQPVDPPPGHRGRGSPDLDIARWDLAKLTPRSK